MFDPSLVHPEHIRPLTRTEYDRIVDTGIFDGQELELLRGMLVTMSPQGEVHAGLTAWLVRWFVRKLDGYDVRGHSPYAATDDSEPEPDVTVSRATHLFAHPTSPLLVIEVSDSSIRKDRTLKSSIYAEAGAPEYWIIDVTGDELVVQVHTQPSPLGYGRTVTLRDGDVLRPTLLDLELPVLDLPFRRD
ncbi:MAG: Uma2 family endonuclease [Deltaproteobacteria bacterium]|nr:Uma2 family endonuclease [Deltaproteobacteria bacterium]